MEHEPIQPIAESLWWVIPNKVAGVRKPVVEELSELRSLGVTAIVSVMDDPSNLDLYKQAGIPYLWLPVKGGTAPQVEQIKALTDFIEQQSNSGHGIAIHCTSGRKRTGTFLAAYLIGVGKTYEEALEIVYATNPAVELREAQTEFLKDFSQNHDYNQQK